MLFFWLSSNVFRYSTGFCMKEIFEGQIHCRLYKPVWWTKILFQVTKMLVFSSWWIIMPDQQWTHSYGWQNIPLTPPLRPSCQRVAWIQRRAACREADGSMLRGFQAFFSVETYTWSTQRPGAAFTEVSFELQQTLALLQLHWKYKHTNTHARTHAFAYN